MLLSSSNSMAYKYFRHSLYTEASLNKERKKLSFKYHPDTGGNESDFIAMNVEYEVLLKQVKDKTNINKTVTEPTHQQTKKNNQSSPKKQEPQKTKVDPIRHINPDFVFLRSYFKKFGHFTQKHQTLFSSRIHTFLAFVFSIFGCIFFLGGSQLIGLILLVYSLSSFVIFRHYFLALMVVGFFWYLAYPEANQFFFTVILSTFVVVVPVLLVRADDIALDFYH